MPPLSGILVIDKPSGVTSHDVVRHIRRASGARRVGHAGTLDPLATGVLVVCLGSATRVIPEIQETQKQYRARIRLGVTTTTYDAEGEVVERHDPSGVERPQLEAALSTFRGQIWQTPPMHSALKHRGRRLYELARSGVEVERQPRPVVVYDLDLTAWEPPELTLEMTVSKGTYVRALAHDLGQKLGVGAHLVGLRRTAVGRFGLQDAEPLARAVAALEEGWWPELLLPLDAALVDYEAMILDARQEAAVRHGQQIEGPAPRADSTALVRAYGPDGLLIGLLRWDRLTERWQPDRVFPRPR